jgi:acyl-CoA dehydrogenase
MSIDQEGVASLLAEVERFARERIAPATSRPEAPVTNEDLQELTSEAAALGIPAGPGASGGSGLWARVDTPQDMALHIGALKRIARANAGVAFAWHRRALAQYLAGALGFTADAADMPGLTLVLSGHHGLCGASLAHWLRGVRLAAGEPDLLAGWLDREQRVTALIAAETWKIVLWPVWRDGAIRWEAARRDALTVEERHPQRGLDELAVFHLRGRGEDVGSPAAPAEERRELYGRLLKLDMIGLLAIGTGVGAHGFEVASGYASIRRPGEAPIGERPAVQQMLADIELALSSADIALRSCGRPPGLLDLGGVAAIRVSVNAMLRHAANQAVQVYGGFGYVRDAAAEKILRDLNTLKAQTGGTRDLALFVAGWRGGPA